MTIKSTLKALGALAAAGTLGAAPLGVATAVQSRPDASAPVITVLKAGSEQPSVSTTAPAAPQGWQAVDVPGPFTAWVKNKDLTKDLDIKSGASVYAEPNETSAVLEEFAKGDKAEVTGIRGKWTQVRLDKTIVGYIKVGAALSEAPAPAPVTTAPASVAASVTPGAPAPAAGPADTSPADQNGSMSRLFEGTLTTTKSLLAPRRPYDWQLVDDTGKRIAYVDLHKLLLTDQIENYGGHAVVVLGALKPVEGTRDLVITAEGFRLK